MRDDPELIHVGRSTRSTSGCTRSGPFNYKDRIFATPVISLPIVDKAIEELEWVVERGARVILVRPAPVPGFRGTRSFALPEFDPFWKRVERARRAGRDAFLGQRLRPLRQDWDGSSTEMLPFVAERLPDGGPVAPGRPTRGLAGSATALFTGSRSSRWPSSRTASAWLVPLLN